VHTATHKHTCLGDVAMSREAAACEVPNRHVIDSGRTPRPSPPEGSSLLMAAQRCDWTGPKINHCVIQNQKLMMTFTKFPLISPSGACTADKVSQDLKYEN